MSYLDYTSPLVETNVKLCAAVKKYKCLHDKNSYHKNPSTECEVAWQMVSLECKESVEFCKNRWKSLRRCFFKGLKRRGNKYYLHDHLLFLQDKSKRKPKRNSNAILKTETNKQNETKHDDEEISFQRSEMEIIDLYDDDEETKSISSNTTSADESSEIIDQTNQAGVFIIDELDQGDDEKYSIDDRRSSYQRSCKRPLDPQLIDELVAEEQKEKRARKNTTDKHKIAIIDHDRTFYPTQVSSKQYRIKTDQSKLNVLQYKLDTNTVKMIDRFTSTDFKPTRDFATQCDRNYTEYDDTFMNSIKKEMLDMNPRQKMNFKCKVYQSLLEVFDDATDFPIINELLQLPNKQAPRVINSTVGELRLMRELVSLVQAAKTTPEIMDANESVKASTQFQTKPSIQMPVPIIENPSKSLVSTPSQSPDIDDEDVQIPNDNTDDDVSLPHSSDEIRTNSSQSTKPTNDDNSKGLPHRILQKVVKVSGSVASTIVTQNGDKKRIYRIYPKLINPNQHDNQILPSKQSNSVGTFFVSPSRNAQNAASTINNNNNPVSNINIRTFQNKPMNNTTEITNSVSKSNQSISNSTANSPKIVFKNVHPANRILCASTGSFKTISPASTYIRKPTSSGAPSTTKVITAKSTRSPMLPPISNALKLRTDATRVAPLQRRYSICGPPPAEKPNNSSPKTAITDARNSNCANDSKTQEISTASQMKISQPVSLNNKPPSGALITSSNNTMKISKEDTRSIESIKVPFPTTHPARCADIANYPKDAETPIFEAVGTVEADVLDPLFVKPPTIKSEPVD